MTDLTEEQRADIILILGLARNKNVKTIRKLRALMLEAGISKARVDFAIKHWKDNL